MLSAPCCMGCYCGSTVDADFPLSQRERESEREREKQGNKAREREQEGGGKEVGIGGYNSQMRVKRKITEANKEWTEKSQEKGAYDSKADGEKASRRLLNTRRQARGSGVHRQTATKPPSPLPP